MIYLLRHGQTAYNAERRMQGHLDTPLNAKGEAQARAMAATLADLIPDPTGWRLIASPLGRAQQTAAAVSAALSLPIETDHRLIEVTVGDWEGRLVDEVRQTQAALMDRLDWCFCAPGGETYPQMAERIAAFLAEVAEDDHLILVCHGVSGRVLRGLYQDLPRDEALALPAPQDGFFRLSGRGAERIDCLQAT